MNLLDTIKTAGNDLVLAGAADLKARYLQPGSLSGSPVTVTGNGVAVPAGQNQTQVRASTLPDTPTVGAQGMSTGTIIMIVLGVLVAVGVGYKLVK